jgi:hypothetical protein
MKKRAELNFTDAIEAALEGKLIAADYFRDGDHLGFHAGILRNSSGNVASIGEKTVKAKWHIFERNTPKLSAEEVLSRVSPSLRSIEHNTKDLSVKDSLNKVIEFISNRGQQ